MFEDWRRALDKNLVVGIVFVDIRKAFDSISHHVLLKKLQAVGVAGDLWCWIKDYLAGRSQATVVNGFHSEILPVKFGVPQGSVLGLTLFLLFCNDLPDIVGDCDGDIHMYADDTTTYAIAPSTFGDKTNLFDIHLNSRSLLSNFDKFNSLLRILICRSLWLLCQKLD